MCIVVVEEQLQLQVQLQIAEVWSCISYSTCAITEIKLCRGAGVDEGLGVVGVGAGGAEVLSCRGGVLRCRGAGDAEEVQQM